MVDINWLSVEEREELFKKLSKSRELDESLVETESARELLRTWYAEKKLHGALTVIDEDVYDWNYFFYGYEERLPRDELLQKEILPAIREIESKIPVIFHLYEYTSERGLEGLEMHIIDQRCFGYEQHLSKKRIR